MATVKPSPSEKIVCDCCGREILAMRRDGKIIIAAHKHGKKHFAVVPMKNGKENC